MSSDTETPNPGEGWRWVEPGERKKWTDEEKIEDLWCIILVIGKETHVTPSDKFRFRRRVGKDSKK